MNKKPKALFVLLILLAFLSLGALLGGIPMMLDPSGNMLHLPKSLLEESSFNSFLIPGIILFAIFGLFPVFVIFGLIKKPGWKWPENLNLLPDMYWAWTFAVYTGLGQIIWISIQTFVINQVGIVHIIYTLLGISIASVALLTPVRLSFSKLNS